MNRKSIFAISLAAAFAVAPVFTASAKVMHPGDNAFHLLKQLDLSAEQRQDIRSLMQQGRADMHVYKDDMRQFKAAMREQIQRDSWDAAQVVALMEEREALTQQVALQRALKKHQVWQLLDDEQQAEFQVLVQNRSEDKKRDNPMKRLKRLGLDDSQHEQAAAIFELAKQNSRNAHDTLKTLRQAERQLIQADSFDTDAWQDVFEAQANAKQTVALERAHARHQVWNLLTDEQKAKAEKLADQHHRAMKDKRSARTGI